MQFALLFIKPFVLLDSGKIWLV